MNPNCHVMSVYYLSDSPIKWIYLHCLPNEKYIANYMGRIWKLETLRTDTKQTKIKTHTQQQQWGRKKGRPTAHKHDANDKYEARYLVLKLQMNTALRIRHTIKFDMTTLICNRNWNSFAPTALTWFIRMTILTLTKNLMFINYIA